MNDYDQLDRDALKTMRPEQIEQARLDGRLDRLMGAPETVITATTRARTGHTLDRADVASLRAAGRHTLITEAAERGQITH